MALPGQFEVGQLYQKGLVNGQQVWTQPGGVGTPVYPQQPQGEHSALYRPICVHWVNCMSVQMAYDPYAQQQVALICCPQCLIITEIIQPYSNYEDANITPILVV